MELTISQISDLLSGTYRGDCNTVITAVRGIEDAQAGDVSFVANAKYRKHLSTTNASAVLVVKAEDVSVNQIIVPEPYTAFGKLLEIFYPRIEAFEGLSEKAFIENGASVSAKATVLPFACIRNGALVKKGAIIYSGVYVGENAVIGEGSILHPNVVVYDSCIIGDGVIIHAGSVVGSDGFGFANPGHTNTKIPQVGFVQIDDGCEIGSNVSIDRGTIGKTWIQKNVKIDNLVQIAHNVTIGENSIIVSQTGIAGSATLGKSVVIGGQSGIVGHITVGDNVMAAARVGIHKDVPAASIIAGTPHKPYHRWLRTEATISRLPELNDTINVLKKKVDELEKKIPS